MVFVYRKFNLQSEIIFKDSFFWQSEVFHSTSLFDSQGSLHKKVRTLQKKLYCSNIISKTFKEKITVRYIAHSVSYNNSCFLYNLKFNEYICDWSFNIFIAKECEIANCNFPIKCDSVFFCSVVRGQFSTVQCTLYVCCTCTIDCIDHR